MLFNVLRSFEAVARRFLVRRLVAANAAAAAASAGGDVDSVCVLCVLLYLCVYLIDIAPHGSAARVSVCAKSYL